MRDSQANRKWAQAAGAPRWRQPPHAPHAPVLLPPTSSSSVTALVVPTPPPSLALI